MVFADGGLAGETVRVALTTAKKTFARGQVIEVLDASPDRCEPSCSTHARGCGGCDLAHCSGTAQLEIKRHVVRDALTRIGRLDPDHVDNALDEGAGVAHTSIPGRYRTTVRMAIDRGRLSYRKRASHDTVHPEECTVVHPQLEELIRDARFRPGAGTEAVVRVSAHSGEAVIAIDGDPAAVDASTDVQIVKSGIDGVGTITEAVSGRLFQVSANSFFQAGPEVASALVDAVGGAVGTIAGRSLIDAYAGVGLFAGTVGVGARSVIAVEQSTSACGDAEQNLPEPSTTIINSSVEQFHGEPADVVIADPSRAGLGQGGVDVLAPRALERLVLVSCDTGSLGRDANLLAAVGFELESVQVVDAFHNTSHVEVVAAFLPR